MMRVSIEKLKGEMVRLHPKDSCHSSLLQGIISKQESLIEQLMNEKDQLHSAYSFVCQDRLILLTENNELKKRLSQLELNQTLQLQQFIKKSTRNLLSPLFQTKQESSPIGSFQAERSGMRLIQEVDSFSRGPCSSIGSHGKTPILHQPVFRERAYRTKFDLAGLLRAFYLQGLREPLVVKQMEEIIEVEYKFGDIEGNWLFDKLPDNELIGTMLLNFIEKASSIRQCSQLVEKLNKYQFYDDIFIQMLTHKIKDFKIDIQLFNQEIVHRCLFALSNTFNLQLMIQDHQFFFFIDPHQRMPSQESELDNVYEEISLNPRPKESLNCPPKADLPLLFTINWLQEEDCFEILAKEEREVGSVLDEYQLSYSSQINQLRGFDRSSPSQSDIIINEYKDHFVDVPSILSSPQQASLESVSMVSRDCSKQLFLQARRRHLCLHGGSAESILLSGYTSNRCSQEMGKIREFRSLKENNPSNCVSAKKNCKYLGSVLSEIDSNNLAMLKEQCDMSV